MRYSGLIEALHCRAYNELCFLQTPERNHPGEQQSSMQMFQLTVLVWIIMWKHFGLMTS